MKKKILTLALAFTLGVTALAGCGSDKEKSAADIQNEGSDKAQDSTKADEKEKTGDAAKSDDAKKQEDTASKESSEIYVFIAASLNNAMSEIQTMYQKKNPEVTIIYNAESSGTLQKQIEEGAQCDIFFSAATKQMDALKDSGYVEETNIVNLLENKVVLIKPAGEDTKVTGFDTITEASSLALAGEDVPVGQYARKIFDKMGNTDQVMAMEINEGANVTAVLTAVSEKSNEVGIVYATDAMSMKDSVEVIAEAPAEYLDEPVLYPVGLVKDDQAAEAAKAAASDFYQYLQTDEAQKVFENYGFSSYNK